MSQDTAFKISLSAIYPASFYEYSYGETPRLDVRTTSAITRDTRGDTCSHVPVQYVQVQLY